MIMKAFIQTFKYAFLTVPLELIFALFIAYILNFKIKGVKFFQNSLLYSFHFRRIGFYRSIVEIPV